MFFLWSSKNNGTWKHFHLSDFQVFMTHWKRTVTPIILYQVHLVEVTDGISDIQGVHVMYWWNKDTQHTLSGVDEGQIDRFPLTRPCCTGQSVRLITLKRNWVTESSNLKSHTPVLKSSDLVCFHSLLALRSIWKQLLQTENHERINHCKLAIIDCYWCNKHGCRCFSVDSFFSFFLWQEFSWTLHRITACYREVTWI